MESTRVNDSPAPVDTSSSYPDQRNGALKDVSSERDISSGNVNYQTDCAVHIRGVHKRYEHGPSILKNFCMSVKKGTIYGLLGSSGCGKTTILSCIVGLQKCDSGDIRVFGMEPGTKGSGIPGRRLGYMPQDLALYHHLTSKEVIRFYGKLYGMTSREIEDQWDFLNTLLQLPSNSTIIINLSGGQQRRVSLALALIHSPELLILDEPTVGLDPLLRTDIWSYLYQIVQKLGTTIIITTHYIEEARNSNTIGVMRSGRLLVEDSPSDLLRGYNCELLEQVVLKLCTKDQKIKTGTKAHEQQDNQMLSDYSYWNESVESALVIDKAEYPSARNNIANSQCGTMNVCTNVNGWGFFQSLQRIYAFTTVILMNFVRNPVFIGVTLFLPCVQGSLTLLCVGSKPGGMHLGIVNPEMSNRTLECDSANHFRGSCDLSALSCNFLNHLRRDNMVILRPFESESDALSHTRIGKISGYLTFPANYSQHNLALFTEKLFSSTETIEGSRIHVYLDYSQNILVLLTIKHLYTSYLLYVKELATSCEIGGQQAELPIVFRTPVFGKEDDYTAFIVPGLVLVSIVAVGFSLNGMMIVSDRRQGTLSRAHVAGLTIADVFASHLVVHSLVAIAEIAIWNLILYFGFGFEVAGPPWLMIAYCLLTHLCGSALGIFVGQVFSEELHVLYMAIFLFLIFIQFTTALFPQELMSTFWMHVSYAVPTTLPTIALRAIMVRGIGLADPLAWFGLLALIAWISGLLFLGVLLYKKFSK